MRAVINEYSRRRVTLTYTDDVTGIVRSREFQSPRNGGYVTEDGKQVCAQLSARGDTLYCSNTQNLVDIIRREWRAYKEALKYQEKGG